jgi:pyridoxamine---pyruvate transaminase
MYEVADNFELLTMAAGPNSIHDRIRQAYSRQLYYHYDPEFHALFNDTTDKLKKIYQTTGDVIIMQGEAVLGLESAAAGTLAPGDKTLNLVTGVFGEGYARHMKRYSGLDPIELRVPYNQSIDPAEVEKILAEHGDIKAIGMVHSETPSGTLNPVKEICEIAQKYDAITIVDAVSSFTGMPVPVDEWGVDICIAGPQKCLGAAPGSSIMAVSDRAWERMLNHPNPLRKSYMSMLDWKELWIENKRFPFTPFVGQINGINEAFTMVLEEGLEKRFARHTLAAEMTRAGIRALGMEMWPESDEITATCVSAITVPEGIDAHKLMKIMRDKYKLMISGSLKELDGKVIRIGHMAHMARPNNVVTALSILERSLKDLGYSLKLGTGVGTALELLD